VSVLDTGIGIPHDGLHSVFEMFSQVHSHHTNDGLGIGLALVRQLVSLHGGDVTVTSDGPGQGSCFTVRLPLLAELPSGYKGPGSAARPSALGRIPRKVLVVDDNFAAARSLEQLLTLQGHDVSICTSGVEAVLAARLDPPDVIFMDVGMPGMDGLAAARMIRAQAGNTPIRIVALTGWGQESDRERSRNAGMDDHVVKPVSPETLREIL
jgi:CheY-like chemotaxis protein